MMAREASSEFVQCQFSPVIGPGGFRLRWATRKDGAACDTARRMTSKTVLDDHVDSIASFFVGQCRFALRCADAGWRRRVGLLTSFAPFAGVGWRTTMGLGQVKRIPT